MYLCFHAIINSSTIKLFCFFLRMQNRLQNHLDHCSLSLIGLEVDCMKQQNRRVSSRLPWSQASVEGGESKDYCIRSLVSLCVFVFSFSSRDELRLIRYFLWSLSCTVARYVSWNAGGSVDLYRSLVTLIVYVILFGVLLKAASTTVLIALILVRLEVFMNRRVLDFLEGPVEGGDWII
jgi:hypothetical protein